MSCRAARDRQSGDRTTSHAASAIAGDRGSERRDDTAGHRSHPEPETGRATEFRNRSVASIRPGARNKKKAHDLIVSF